MAPARLTGTPPSSLRGGREGPAPQPFRFVWYRATSLGAFFRQELNESLVQKGARSCIEKRTRGVDAYVCTQNPGRVIYSSSQAGLTTLFLDGVKAERGYTLAQAEGLPCPVSVSDDGQQSQPNVVAKPIFASPPINCLQRLSEAVSIIAWTDTEAPVKGQI